MPRAPSIVDVPLSAARPCPVAATSTASTFNVTVDDYGLDIHTGNVISYNGSWGFGQTCTVCKARADPAQTYNSTWRDTTMQFLQNPTFAMFNFTGSAIYAYGLLCHHQGTNPTCTSQLRFYIDNQLYGSFEYVPDGTAGFTYNTLLFSVDTLPHGPHEFVIQNGVDNKEVSLLLFDYLIYTTKAVSFPGVSHVPPSSTTSGSQSPPVSHILPPRPIPTATMANAFMLYGFVGLAFFAGIVAATGAVWFYCHRRKSQKRLQMPARASFGRTIITDDSITVFSSITPALERHGERIDGITSASNVGVVQSTVASAVRHSGKTGDLAVISC